MDRLGRAVAARVVGLEQLRQRRHSACAQRDFFTSATFPPPALGQTS